ncbi:MAG: heat-inducible transcriptional repressor HrcA [Thermoanaerobaculia bacterium]
MTAKSPNQDEVLEGRWREVMREIVLQFIAHGEPVSSRSLSKSGRFNLSPASLRNVMADLEDLGFVQQPHTSAGRIPTDRGYRFFIDHLMRSHRLQQVERSAIEEGMASATELDHVMHIASKVLSQLSDQVGLAFIPTLHQLSMRSIDFIPVAERKIMCVVVGTDGVVVNKIVDTTEPYSREELERIAHQITDDYHGMTLSEIREKLLAAIREERAKFDRQYVRTLELGVGAVEGVMPHEQELVLEGASSIFNKPEFSDVDAMRKAMLAFQEKEKLVAILNRCLNEDGLRIFVGSESPYTQDYNFSIVATRYGSGRVPLGLVGVIGPTRMEYARVSTIVDYLAQVMTRRIEEAQENG